MPYACICTAVSVSHARDIVIGIAKTAITMTLADCGLEEARERLAKAKGRVRKAIR